MDSGARYHLFTVGMIAIERNDAFTASVVHRLLDEPRFDQPRYTDVDISGLFPERPATSEVPPASEIPSASASSSPPYSYQPEAWSDSSACTDIRPSRRPGKRMTTRKVYKDSHSRESRVAAQRIIEDDIEEEHRAARIPFSPERICIYDVEPNVVGPDEIMRYMRRFDLDSNEISLIPAEGRAAWNPPPGHVAIYGSMLTCGVTLPLQPFITWFLAEARLAPAQLTPNSYRILMCMWHMWHRMKRPPPTPREVRHFYSLRPVGKTGIYFLQSNQPKFWIPKDVVVKGSVEPTTDEKMKGFVWGFPTSNKFWKNSWFFVGKDWGQSISFDLDGTQMTCQVPRYFCTPQWNHLTSAFTDEELKTLARAAVRPLEKRGKPYLYREGKMIKAHLFPQISACRRRHIVSDGLARRMKGIVEASRKAVLRQRDAGIAPPEDESDEGTPENVPEGDDEEGVPDYVPEEAHDQEPTVCSAGAEGASGNFGVSRTFADSGNPVGPSSKGKEKVGDLPKPEQANLPSGSGSPHSAADMQNVPSEAVGGPSGAVAPEFPTSVEPNRSSSEIPASADPISTPGDSNTEAGQTGKRKASFSSGRPFPKIPRVVAYVNSSSEDEGEGDASVTPPREQVRESAGGSTGLPRAAPSAELPEGDVGDMGSSPQIDDPTPETIFRAMASGRAYIGEDHWSHFRTGTVSDRLRNFFNSASYMVAEMSGACQAGEAQAEKIRRLEAQLKESEDHCSRAELARQEEARSSEMLINQCLARQMEAEQRASSAAEEVRTLQDQLSSTREALLRAEQNAEDGKSAYERRIDDLECQALTAKELSKGARLEMELQSVDRFKRSPAYDALLLREFQRGMVSAGEFFKQKNRATDRARANWSLSIRKHVDTSLESLRIQMKEWRAYCRSKGKTPHPMHLEVPTAESFSTFYASERVSFNNEIPDLGPVPGTDYSHWMDDEEDVIVWPSDDSLLSEYVMEPDPDVGRSSSPPPAPSS
ncbi:hypothetical protein LWI29_015697 [Acer saccharum]|uniref:Uncharacterized protein n=1 Tax=Acer saccharum TaxID=4024 RepID=A0AA39S885_ACESA|nr:hypothetical protein LWI29_015697 [Acer saccharum]